MNWIECPHAQVFKMETEASKMQDDYDVYNNINEELKVTPAYIKVCIDRYLLSLQKMTFLRPTKLYI